MNRSLALLATILLALAARSAVAADLVVIVNSANTNAVTKEFAAKVYRGEAKSWPDGQSVVAYNLPDDHAVRSQFEADVVGKSASQLRALWAGLAFSGKAVPPKVGSGEADVVGSVAANKNAIGYVSASAAKGVTAVPMK
jgi:ABC-type phosphate transport system substrate-binding protein